MISYLNVFFIVVGYKITYPINIEDNLYKFWINLYLFLLVFFKANSVPFMMASTED